jgi:iron complex transport system ATP-binding protein
MSVLTCSGVRVTLGDRVVLDGIDLTLAAGQVTAVVGPNGAGKSTLLACLAGLRTPDTGSTLLDGKQIERMPARRLAQRLAFLPQIPEIAWAIDARTLVGLGRIPFRGARGQGSDDIMAIDRAMALAGVAEFADRVATTLSGGERARVLIARALAGAPEWLLADEPLAGLDPAHQLDMAALFRALAGEGAGVLVTLHDLTLALRLADRVIVLTNGAVIADGVPDAALTPDVLRRAYGVEASLVMSAAGPIIDIVRRTAV